MVEALHRLEYRGYDSPGSPLWMKAVGFRMSGEGKLEPAAKTVQSRLGRSVLGIRAGQPRQAQQRNAHPYDRASCLGAQRHHREFSRIKRELQDYGVRFETKRIPGLWRSL
jgi:glucosamine 6-phosphate synthetase-like amidotransferase/phosphosugar isomerase protein